MTPVWFIEFTYDGQGVETWVTRRLVYADAFEHACTKIAERYKNARDFKNQTVA